jgi:hypothetical protein
VERKDISKNLTYQGLTTCTEVDKSWTIMSSTRNHLRQKRGENISGLGTRIREEVGHQERLEATGYRSPTWRVLRALQSLLSAVQLQGESAVTAPPFFPSAGRGTTRFWGNEHGPTVFLWEGLGEEGREECERVIRTHRDWVVWSRARPMKGDRTPRGFKHAGKAIFCGKVKRSKKEQGEPEAEDEIEEDAPDTEVDESEALIKLQEAWNNSERKDEYIVRVDDLEGAFWMGTEVGQLGGYGFQGATLGVDGSCKDGNMGSGCCRFWEERADKCARVGREEEGTSSNRPESGGVVLALQSAAISKDILLLCDNEAVLCAIKKWVGQGGKARLATSTGY